MKRLLLLVVSFMFVFTVACSNKEEETGGTGDPEGISGEITVWGWDVAAATFEESIELFNKEYPDVKVTVEDFGSGDLYEKLTVGLASKGSGLPDVVLMEDERIPGYIDQFPDGFLNLSELGFDEYADLFSDAKIESVTHDGNLIAAPWDIGPAGMFYRVDIFEEAGVNADDIKTWDDYLEAGKTILEKTGVKMLPIDISSYDGVYLMMMQQQGLSYFDENDEPTFETPEAKRSMEMIKQFYDNDLILNNSGWDGIVTATVNGDVATVPYGVWYTGTIMDQGPDLSGKWDSFFLPEFKEGSSRYANVGGSSILIPSSTDNKNAAYAFVEFFATDDETQLLGFEKYGLFPSLQSTYDSDVLKEDSEFFNNKPIFKDFADIVNDVPAVNITKHYGQIVKLMSNTQASILLEGKPIDEALADIRKEVDNLK